MKVEKKAHETQNERTAKVFVLKSLKKKKKQNCEHVYNWLLDEYLNWTMISMEHGWNSNDAKSSFVWDMKYEWIKWIKKLRISWEVFNM